MKLQALLVSFELIAATIPPAMHEPNELYTMSHRSWSERSHCEQTGYNSSSGLSHSTSSNHSNFVGYRGTWGNGPTPGVAFGVPLVGIANQLPARSLLARVAF